MDDALLMRRLQRVGDLRRVAHGIVDGQGTITLQSVGQRFTLDMLHDEIADPILFANVEQRTDMRVVQARNRPAFVREPAFQLAVGGELIGKDLDGDRATETSVTGPKDDAHATGAELAGNLVWAEHGSGC